MRPAKEPMHPFVKDKLMKQRTLFAPGQRMRMNAVPLFLNLFFPWLIFIFCCGMSSFWIMYSQPGFVKFIAVLLLGAWFLSMLYAARMQVSSDNPTWYAYAAILFGVAVIAGLGTGMTNFEEYMRPWYEIQDLKVVHQLATSVERGQNFMDAGVVYFAHGTEYDGMKSWHFKHHTLYCVAPIISNHSAPATQTYDFWAVGKDCCSMGASDFRCGAWSNPKARSGIRVLNSHDTNFYRLAVQQAETTYGIVASHPLFFMWSEDPLQEVNAWHAQAFKNFLFLTASSLVVSFCCLAFAACNFAYIGRSGSIYDRNVVGESMYGSA